MGRRTVLGKIKKAIAWILCVCMLAPCFDGVSLASDTVVDENDKTGTNLHYVVQHMHYDGTETVTEGYIEPEDKPVSVEFSPYDDEQYSGIGITAGNSAVKLGDSQVIFSYVPGLHLAKVQVFYQNTGSAVLGKVFGEADGNESGENDTHIYGTKVGEDDSVKKDIRIYDTSMGLHTDKRIVPVTGGDFCPLMGEHGLLI